MFDKEKLSDAWRKREAEGLCEIYPYGGRLRHKTNIVIGPEVGWLPIVGFIRDKVSGDVFVFECVSGDYSIAYGDAYHILIFKIYPTIAKCILFSSV